MSLSPEEIDAAARAARRWPRHKPNLFFYQESRFETSIPIKDAMRKLMEDPALREYG
jgi:hypothetical protein